MVLIFSDSCLSITVTWTTGFPHRDEIVEQIEGVWKGYNLESSTRLNVSILNLSR